MDAKDKSPPKQHARKRSVPEPREPRAKRRAGNAATVADVALNVNATGSVHPPFDPPRQLDDGIASSRESDIDAPYSMPGSTPATPVVAMHFCGHCQKRFRSPGKLARHERVHATETVPFRCSFCPKQFCHKSKATEHERIHTGEKPYACSLCPKRFARTR